MIQEPAVDVADRPVWLVRIAGRRVGAGTLVSDRHVVTCAHVVSSGPGSAPLEVTFPFLEPRWKASAQVLASEPAPGDDVAILKLVPSSRGQALPAGAQPATFMPSAGTRGHHYRAYGYPSGGVPGGWSYGIVAGSVGRNRLQLDRDLDRGYPIVLGFSGGPIWDDDAMAVIGIVHARHHDPEEGIQVGFGIASEALALHLAAAGIETTWRVRSAESVPPAPTATPTWRAPPFSDAGGPGSSLPFPYQSLIGRERESARAVEHLIAGVRLLTLTGPGGVGKSQLALYVARQLAEQFDGVCFVDLTLVRDPAFVLYELAAKLDVLPPPADTPLLAVVQLALRESRRLLVIDNFEHVVGAAPLLVELLGGCPNLQLLVTSRTRLRVMPEHELAVPPLQLPDSTMPLRRLRRVPAVAMFTRRAVATDDSFRLTEDNAATVAEICVRLDGLPLAIELAAARVKLLGPTALLARLGNRLDLLTGGMRDRPARHHSLRATLEWSYHLLAPAHREAFAQVAVFSGGWTLAAAEQVCTLQGNALLEALATLMDDSLLYRRAGDEDGPRYFTLETVREYGQAVLMASGTESAVRTRHARWCLQMAESLVAGTGQDQFASVATLDHESANVRAALGWLRGSGHLELGLRLAIAVAWYWDLRGQFDEGRDWLDGMLRKAADAGRSMPEDVMAQACSEAGFLAFRRGAYDDAANRFEEGLRRAAAIGEHRPQAWAWHGLAVLRLEQGDVAASRSAHDEAVRLFERVGDRRGLAGAMLNRGIAHFYRGEFDRAQSASEDSLRRFRELRNAAGAAAALTTLGATAHYLGHDGQAIALLEEALDLRRALGDHRGTAASLINLGWLATHGGNYALALHYLGQSLPIEEGLGDKRGIATALDNQGLAMHHLGNNDRAVAVQERALRLWREIGDSRGVGRSLCVLARTSLAAGDEQRADRLAREALAILEDLGDQFELASAQQLAADIAGRIGGRRRAAGLLVKAVRLFVSLGMRSDAASCLEHLAEFALGDARTDLAVRLIAVADRLRPDDPSPHESTDTGRRRRVLDACRGTLGSDWVDACLATASVDMYEILAEAAAIVAGEET